eukprot:4700837-Prymnesium_polylepis.1
MACEGAPCPEHAECSLQSGTVSRHLLGSDGAVAQQPPGIKAARCYSGLPKEAFVCVPENELDYMLHLLRGGDPHVKVMLLVGFYTQEMACAYRESGWVAITCDYCYSEAPGMRYLGDVRVILYKRWWGGV